MTLTTVPTVVVGQLHTAAMWNTYIRDNENWWQTRRQLRAHRSTTSFSLANATVQTVTFDNKPVDTDSFLNLSPGTTPTIPTGLDGTYAFFVSVALPATLTASLQFIRLGGLTGFPEPTLDGPNCAGAASGLLSAAFGPFSLAAGANCLVQLFQNSGGAITVNRVVLIMTYVSK